MEATQPKPGKYSLQYGLVLGVLSVVFSVMLFTMDAHYTQSWVNTTIGIVMMAGITLWGISSFRKANEGFLSMGEALKLGAGIALVSGLIVVAYTIILAEFIDPDFPAKVMENRLAEPLANGEITAEQAQQQQEMGVQYFWTGYPFILIINILFGLLIGFVGGLIFKKAKPAY